MDNSYSLHRPCARMERWRRVVTLQYAYHSDAEPLKSDCFIQIGVFDCKVHKQKPHVKVGLFRMVTNRTSPRLLVWESGRCGLWRSLRVPGHGQWLWGERVYSASRAASSAALAAWAFSYSSLSATTMRSNSRRPVPAGMRCPQMTFSFMPSR